VPKAQKTPTMELGANMKVLADGMEEKFRGKEFKTT